MNQFDHPYLLTMGYDDGIPFVRYQSLPAHMHSHRVTLVQYKSGHVEYWSGRFHCVDCGLMGTTNTMKVYTCRH